MSSTTTSPPARPAPGAQGHGAEAGSMRRTVEGVLLVLLALAGWTIAPLMIKHFAPRLDAWTQNGWRYGLSALIWLPLLLYRLPGLDRRYWKSVLIISAINVLAQVQFALAFYYTGATMVTFGLRFQIIAAVVLSAMLFSAEREVIRKPLFMLGILAVVGGAMATVFFGGPGPAEAGGGTAEGAGQLAEANPFTADRPALGFALAAGAGVLYAGYAAAVRGLMRGVGSFTAFAGICQGTAIAMVVLMLVFARDRATLEPDLGMSVLSLTAAEIGLLLGSAVAGIAIGHVVFYLAISRLGVATSTGIVQIQPFMVAVPSVLFFGEVLGPVQWIGGMFAVAGAITIVIMQHRASSAAAASQVGIEQAPAPEELPVPVDDAAYEADERAD